MTYSISNNHIHHIQVSMCADFDDSENTIFLMSSFFTSKIFISKHSFYYQVSYNIWTPWYIEPGFKISLRYIFQWYWREDSKYYACDILNHLPFSNSHWRGGSIYYGRDIFWTPLYFHSHQILNLCNLQ